jgi:hypothetical protein
MVSVLLLAASACARAGAGVTDVAGNCADVFGAQICTWARLNGGTVVEAGATVPIATVEGAPEHAHMAWPPVPAASVDLPDVVRTQTGLAQLTVNWESGGHPPGAFLTPHFDFHFYAIPTSEMTAIDCADLTKPTAPPAGYDLPDIALPPDMAKMMGASSLVGLCVPQMGMHAIATAEIERQTAFDGTMVVGYYKGRPIFVEPMISRAMLMRKASFDLPIPNVPDRSWAQPTRFRADYDPSEHAYRFTLSAFAPGS